MTSVHDRSEPRAQSSAVITESRSDAKQAKNTDRELWRERADDYYAPSIHVTQGGGIGIDVGGTVYVKPLREWHRLAGGKITLHGPEFPQGWQPIESAPRDGASIDLWCRAPGISAGSGRVTDCWFSGGYWWRYDEHCGDDQCRSKVHNVTHWMPLPGAPQNGPNDDRPAGKPRGGLT